MAAFTRIRSLIERYVMPFLAMAERAVPRDELARMGIGYVVTYARQADLSDEEIRTLFESAMVQPRASSASTSDDPTPPTTH